MTEPLSYLTAFTLGFLGSAHCLGMCGGIVGALSFNNQGRNPLAIHLSYQVGRITTYALLGLLVGLLGLWASQSHEAVMFWMRTLSGVLLVLMGLYLVGLTSSLNWLEKAGGYLWQKIQPVSKHLLPVTHPSKGFALGLVWGFLPCGLIYSTLTWAGVSGHPVHSALLMACFGLGNLPALLSAGFFASQINWFRRQKAIKYVFGFAIVSFGVWTLIAIW